MRVCGHDPRHRPRRERPGDQRHDPGGTSLDRYPAREGIHADHAQRQAGRRSRARGSSGRVAPPPAAAWPRRPRRTSGRGHPSLRCGRRSPASSSRHSYCRSSRCTIPATTARCGRAPARPHAAIRISAGVANAGVARGCSRAGSGRETAHKASTQSETDEPANGKARKRKPPRSRRLSAAHGALVVKRDAARAAGHPSCVREHAPVVPGRGHRVSD